jgi:hypothetical protein
MKVPTCGCGFYGTLDPLSSNWFGSICEYPYWKKYIFESIALWSTYHVVVCVLQSNLWKLICLNYGICIKHMQLNWHQNICLLWLRIRALCLGESTLSPSNIIITSTIFLKIFLLIMYGHHILHYFCLF